MVFEELVRYCEKTGEFPREVDVSGYLDVLEFEVNLRIDEEKLSREEPFPIPLEKYTDEPGFYCIEDDIAFSKLGIWQHCHPSPFMMKDDDEALEKLRSKLQEYNNKYSKPIFSVGELGENVFGGKGLLKRIAENPKDARQMCEKWSSFV